MTTFLRRFRPLAVLALAVAVAVGGTSAADHQEAPKPADLKEAVDTLKDVYEKDYTAAESDPKAQRALADKLFAGAPKRKTAAMRYASYDEARRLAATAGEAKLALEALAALTANFKGVPPTLATDTLKPPRTSPSRYPWTPWHLRQLFSAISLFM